MFNPAQQATICLMDIASHATLNVLHALVQVKINAYLAKQGFSSLIKLASLHALQVQQLLSQTINTAVLHVALIVIHAFINHPSNQLDAHNVQQVTIYQTEFVLFLALQEHILHL